jgi:hypothetical protein
MNKRWKGALFASANKSYAYRRQTVDGWNQPQQLCLFGSEVD